MMSRQILTMPRYRELADAIVAAANHLSAGRKIRLAKHV